MCLIEDFPFPVPDNRKFWDFHTSGLFICNFIATVHTRKVPPPLSALFLNWLHAYLISLALRTAILTRG
jgi:hypothetical protein